MKKRKRAVVLNLIKQIKNSYEEERERERERERKKEREKIKSNQINEEFV